MASPLTPLLAALPNIAIIDLRGVHKVCEQSACAYTSQAAHSLGHRMCMCAAPSQTNTPGCARGLALQEKGAYWSDAKCSTMKHIAAFAKLLKRRRYRHRVLMDVP